MGFTPDGSREVSQGQNVAAIKQIRSELQMKEANASEQDDLT